MLYADALLTDGGGAFKLGFPRSNATIASLAMGVNHISFYDLPTFLQLLKKKKKRIETVTGPTFTFNAKSEQEVEHLYIQAIMKNLSLGSGWCDTAETFLHYPEIIMRLKALAKFSARANAVPLRPTSNLIDGSPPDIVVAIWADKNNLLIAIYRYGGKSDKVLVRVNRDILKKYGQSGKVDLKATLINKDGYPQVNSDFRIIFTSKSIKIEGRMSKGELVLIENKE